MHNLLLLISLAENKADSQPTVNNPDSSPIFNFYTMLSRLLFSGLHVGAYL